jgi:hypothetical protein
VDADVSANERRHSERDQGNKEMTQAQKVFEALMLAKGYTDFNKIKDRYINPSVQTRWNYFILGWQLRGVQ